MSPSIVFCSDRAGNLNGDGLDVHGSEAERSVPQLVILHDRSEKQVAAPAGAMMIGHMPGCRAAAVVDFLANFDPQTVVHLVAECSRDTMAAVRRLDDALGDPSVQAAYVLSSGDSAAIGQDRFALIRNIARGAEAVDRGRLAVRASLLTGLDGAYDLFDSGSIEAFLVRSLVESTVAILPGSSDFVGSVAPVDLAGRDETRQAVFEVLQSPECLAVVGEIFPPIGAPGDVPKSLRKWYLGQRLLTLDDIAARRAGLDCLRDALRDNDHVSPIVSAVLGASPRQVLEMARFRLDDTPVGQTPVEASGLNVELAAITRARLSAISGKATGGGFEIDALEMELNLARQAVEEARASAKALEGEVARLTKALRIAGETSGGAMAVAGPSGRAASEKRLITVSGVQVETAPPFEPLGSRIAVVICCYSGEPYFVEAAESVRAQTQRGIELIFHDNGCAESYRRLIEKTAARLGARIIRTEINRYGEGLRYDVLPNLDSEYVAILHDDDYYVPQKIAYGLNYIEKNKLDYLFTDRLYVNAQGIPFPADYEEVNTQPIASKDFPYRLNADTYFSGLRLHFSTLIMKTRFARHNLLGDPFLPRITDSLFMQRLLLNRDVKGAILPDKHTYVRVHGANDMLYDKFAPEQRAREFALLNVGEYFCFQELLQLADDDQLRQTFRIFPRIEIGANEDRVSMLVKAALDLRNWRLSKQLMGAYCIHQAFLIDPLRTMDLVRELSGRIGGGPETDANRLTKGMYQTFVSQLADLLRGQSDDGYRQTLEAVYNSTSWKITEPLRKAVIAVRRRSGRVKGSLGEGS